MTYRLRGLRCISLAVVMLFVALATGCSSSGEDAAKDPGSGGSSVSGSESASGEEQTDGSGGSEDTSPVSGLEETTVSEDTVGGNAEGTSQPERVLPEGWYVDSDDNYVPDFVERDLGYDPKVDDCAKKANCPGPSGAAGTSAVDLVSREQNTLLILDSSGSMAEPIGGGQTKMDAARAALERYATATPDFVNLGFMVYGHKGSNAKADRARSCRSTEMLEPLGEVDYRTFPRTLDTFEPTGWTPIEGALNRAADAFTGKENATNRVILVSDGLETCGGDPAAAAQELAASDIGVTIDVVGFDIPRAEETQLRRIAEVSGGRYATVSSAEELQDYFDGQDDLYYDLLRQSNCMYDHGTEVNNCYSDFNTKTSLRMGDLLDQTEFPSEQWDEIYALKQRAWDYTYETQSRVEDANNKRRGEIEKDMEEVRERMEQRYNEDVSFSPSCPERPFYANSGEGPAGEPKLLALLPPGLSNPTGE